jgi:hypothetical protein
MPTYPEAVSTIPSRCCTVYLQRCCYLAVFNCLVVSHCLLLTATHWRIALYRSLVKYGRMARSEDSDDYEEEEDDFDDDYEDEAPKSKGGHQLSTACTLSVKSAREGVPRRFS